MNIPATLGPYGRAFLVGVPISCFLSLSACVTHAPERAALRPPNPCLGRTTIALPGDGSTQTNPATTTLHLLSVTPKRGSSVTAGTAIVVTVQYSVHDFKPGRFFITPQFAMTTAGMTTNGNFKGFPLIPSAVGRARLCFPMHAVWRSPGVQRPFRMRFLLNRGYGRDVSEPVASTNVLKFRAIKAPPPSVSGTVMWEKYTNALLKVHDAFLMYDTYHQYCATHFPNLSPELNHSFSRWASKYSSVRTRIGELFMRWAHSAYPKRARRVVRQLSKVEVHRLLSVSSDQMPSLCRSMIGFLNSSASNPSDAFPAQLKIISEYAGNPASTG